VLVQVPAMGDSISEGTIAVWHKKAGDQVMPLRACRHTCAEVTVPETKFPDTFLMPG